MIQIDGMNVGSPGQRRRRLRLHVRHVERGRSAGVDLRRPGRVRSGRRPPSTSSRRRAATRSAAPIFGSFAGKWGQAQQHRRRSAGASGSPTSPRSSRTGTPTSRWAAPSCATGSGSSATRALVGIHTDTQNQYGQQERRRPEPVDLRAGRRRAGPQRQRRSGSTRFASPGRPPGGTRWASTATTR